jgi:CheY-like chemotaxis protein
MADFSDPRLCKSILDIAQAYGSYQFWTDNLVLGCNPDATWRALMVAAALKDKLYEKSAEALLESTDSRVKAWACTALAELNSRDAFAKIQALTRGTDNRVRCHARRAVRKMEGFPPAARRYHGRGAVKSRLVLISEDDNDIQRYLNFYLSRIGYMVQTASNEQETTEFAIKLHPQVIITDNQKDNDSLSGLNMTWDLCRRKELRATLFFMVTADRAEPMFIWSGGDEFFTKPVDVNIIGLKLREYFQG